MAELNKWQNGLFRAGAILLLLGFVLRLFLGWEYSCWVISCGALLFSCMQMLARYDGDSFVIKRLRRQQLFSDILFLLMAVMMVLQDYDLGPAWTKGNTWILCLVIAALLQLYTAFRIPKEVEKEL